MANSTAIAAVTLSVREQLERCFVDLDAADPNAFRQLPAVRIVRSEDFSSVGNTANSVIRYPTLTIFCYRVDVNRTMRAPWSAVADQDRRIHLPLDVHLLVTPFDSDAEAELRMLGAAMQCLEQEPILTGPKLHPLGDWDGRESIQLVNEDLVTEDVLRTFDTLPTDFRLSVSYLARICRVDAPDRPDAPDVVTAVSGMVPTSVPQP